MENKKFSFEFTFEQINVILAGLTELPYKISSGVIEVIKESYKGQTADQEPAVEAKPVEDEKA